ncbi:MAG TPA: helix-hairpin-helix domain-containing protein [Flavipsychrobacter sp.]|nr:helix-hairpin-helix domain-containing protein [Flavipsychrobacter sp.]
MTNADIADYFSLLSKLMDIHGEDPFRAKSYSIAAYHIENLPGQAADMDDAELFSMKGIGASTGKKMREILLTGKLQQLEEMLSKTPRGILDMMQVKGLGPKKIAVIWKEMHIDSVGELEYACHENRLTAVKGFGAKTQQGILENIAFLNNAKGFHLWAELYGIANGLIANLRNTYPGSLFETTGGIRRQNETLEMIELITDLERDMLFKNISNIPGAEITDQSMTISLVRLPGQPVIKVFFTTRENFYKEYFLTTGSDSFLKAFLEKYKLPDTVGNEAAIFSSNGLAYIPAPLRETEIILQHAADGELNELIQPGDIKGIIHSHSTWSDGAESIEQMAKVAIEKGFEYLVISDHSQAAYYARGLKPEQIVAQHAEVDALNKKLRPFRVFKSIEADILNDGSLDYNDEVLAGFDLVIASVHSNIRMSLEKAMSRILKAIENPYTAILGHPTGRLLLSREGYPVDHRQIIDACAKHNVVIEINAHPRRLDIDWRWISYAMERGVLLSVDPDAHATSGFNDVFYGTMIAQKGGLTKDCNLSSFSLSEFESFIALQQAKRK